MKLKTVEVLELARPNRAGVIDVVDSDGNVVPLDYLGEDFVPDANSYSDEDFTKRNRIIVEMCDLSAGFVVVLALPNVIEVVATMIELVA
jgi:hypothetical protein